MKTTKIFSIIALIAAASMAFVSCEDDMSKNFKPAQVGDEIFFGGTAGYEDEARTQYGEKGTTGTPIMWYTGDQVRIYCAEARKVEGNSYCDYKVNQTSVTSSTLTSTAAYGLQWGSDADHKFYGVYPSPKMFATGSTEANTFQINGNTLTAYLPYTQNPQGSQAIQKDANGNYTVHPAMRFAYMTATAKANHKTLTADGVTMTFNPIVTAVEISLVNNSTSGYGGKAIDNISGMRIFAPEGDLIAGTFTADVTTGKITDVRNGKNYIDVNVYGEDGYPITLGYGKTLTFTVFMILDENDESYVEGLPSLGVSILSGGVYKSTVVTPAESASGVVNEGLIVNAKKKNFIKGISVAWNTEVDLSSWMASVEDNTPIGMLSIPGAGGVGSNTLSSSYESSKQQTLDVEALWNNGIRCFEMSTTNGSSDPYLVCNGKQTTTKLSSALNTIYNKVKGTQEFAVVIVGYQALSTGEGAFGRNSNNWQENFNSVWSSFRSGKTSNIVKYDPSLTLSQVRGKLMCISRPTAIGGDQWWYSISSKLSHPTDVLHVAGWGPFPDNFYQRGYTKLNRPFYISTKSISNTGEETQGGTNYLYPSYRELDVTHSKKTNNSEKTTWGGELGIKNLISNYSTTDESASNHLKASFGDAEDKFMYRVINPSNVEKFDSEIRVYAQDWKRVSPEGGVKGTYTYTSGWNNSTTFYYYWPSSINEKKNDIVTALNKAISANNQSNTIYINSLCGFYISNSISNSLLPVPSRLAFHCEDWGTSTGMVFYDMKYADGTTTYVNIRNTAAEHANITLKAYNNFGGTEGDIATYAADINQFFYNKLMEIGVSNLSGPTGIVIMDRVKSSASTDADKPGYYLPRFIVENSLRHYGKVGSDLGTGTQGK